MGQDAVDVLIVGAGASGGCSGIFACRYGFEDPLPGTGRLG